MQLTVRTDDAALEAHLKDLARRSGLSVNQAAVLLLRKGAGLVDPPPDARIGSRLDHLSGTWSQAEASDFDRVVADFDHIDEEMWR